MEDQADEKKLKVKQGRIVILIMVDEEGQHIEVQGATTEKVMLQAVGAMEMVKSQLLEPLKQAKGGGYNEE